MEVKHNLEFIMPKLDENRQKTEENGPKHADVGEKDKIRQIK